MCDACIKNNKKINVYSLTQMTKIKWFNPKR